MAGERSSETLTKNDMSNKKKRSHDVAYLIILLTILFVTFAFAMVVVNSLLRNFGI